MSSKILNNKNKIIFLSTGFILTILTAALLNSNTGHNLHNAKAAGVNTADIILGQKTVGNTVVASVCLLADTAINIGDTGVWLKYDNAKLTPSNTLTSKGIYDGPADLSGSYAPMTWSQVAGTTDTYSMKAIFNSNPASALPNSTASTNNTAGLFGSATFNVNSGAGSSTVSVNTTGTGILKRPGNLPLTTTVINFAGDCIDYRAGGVVVTQTLGTAPTIAITGTVGSSLPSFTLVGSNLPSNTSATFTPAGGIAILGSITNGVFTPNAPGTISSTVLTGSQTGVLSVTSISGIASLNIPTNFTAQVVASPVIGTAVASTSNPVTGTIGSQFAQVSLSGNTFANGTSATFTPEGATLAIQGTIQNGNFVPNSNQPIPTGTFTGARVGVLRVGNLSLNVPTNFAQASNPVTPTTNGGSIITITNQNNTTTTTQSQSQQVAPTVKESPLDVTKQSDLEINNNQKNITVNDFRNKDYAESIRTGGAESIKLIFAAITFLALSLAVYVSVKKNAFSKIFFK
jgi:hypothetical protein